MEYITIDTLRKMRAAGFSYPDYEHFLNYGMLYHYNGDEYSIGGFSAGDFSDKDKSIAENGEWLPDSNQLLEWLIDTNFKINISVGDEKYFSIQATDLINGNLYNGGGATLADALAKTITKICKSNQRPYIPKPKLRLEIIG